MRASSKDHPIVSLTVTSPDDDTEHLQRGLSELTHFDPTVSITHSTAGQFVLSGRRVAQLQVICDRIRDEFQLAIEVTAPRAILLETIRGTAEAEGKYIRQTGGKGNYGHCWLRIEPSQPSEGYQFTNDIPDSAVPNEYIKPIEEGVRNAMELGVLAGFPVVDVKATAFDGSYHDVDSNEMAFKFAGSIAFREAAKKALPVVLEPMMAVKIAVPSDLVAAIQHEVRRHRGRVEHATDASGFAEIEAVIPLSELLAMASSELAVYPMEFAGYEAVRIDGWSGEDGSGVIVRKPNDPRPGNRSAMARRPPSG